MFCRFLLALLLMALPAWATILHVPAEYPELQSALDASSPEDTVHVARGTYFGRFTSPHHSLTLCSDYLFTGDSTDINETILDGEFLGTILDVVCWDYAFTLCGFTLQHGMGQRVGGSAYCDRAGAIQSSTRVHLEIRDVVFRENRAPWDVPVLNVGEICTGHIDSGRLTLRNIACFDNTVEEEFDRIPDALRIRATMSTLLIDGFRYDGGDSPIHPIYVYASMMDSVFVNNVHVVDGEQGSASFLTSIRHPTGQSFSNIRVSARPGSPGSRLQIQATHHDVDSSTVVIRNIELEDLSLSNAFYLHTQGTTVDLEGLRIADCRNTGDDYFILMRSFVHGQLRNVELSRSINSDVSPAFCRIDQLSCDGLRIDNCRNTGTGSMVLAGWDQVCSLRHVEMYGNVSGDSLSHQAEPLLSAYDYNIDGAFVHDNVSIIPYVPQYGGGYLLGAMIRISGDAHRVTNLRFENNRLDDLDHYNINDDEYHVTPFYGNRGRELFAQSSAPLTARNIFVRGSRQTNHCPEIVSGTAVMPAYPGCTLYLGSESVLSVDSVRVEDSDDGGLQLQGDSILVQNVVLRNVGRSAFYVAPDPYQPRPQHHVFRNILVEGIQAVDMLLADDMQRHSKQAVLYAGDRTNPLGEPPILRFENATVTGCQGMRHLFKTEGAVDLQVRNCVFWENDCEFPLEWEDPITQSWDYNVVPEGFPEGGNLIDVDPLFDPELGIPWLHEDSPCIDGGDPQSSYNDREDPSNPGWAMFPGQGTVRNDIGYTGGPYAGDLDYVLPVVRRPSQPESRPRDFVLHPARPNPFNPTTTLSYTLTAPGGVELSVYNLQGRRVRTLVSGWQPAGLHEIVLEAGEWASGVYLVELHSNGSRQTTKLLLLK